MENLGLLGILFLIIFIIIISSYLIQFFFQVFFSEDKYFEIIEIIADNRWLIGIISIFLAVLSPLYYLVLHSIAYFIPSLFIGLSISLLGNLFFFKDRLGDKYFQHFWVLLLLMFLFFIFSLLMSGMLFFFEEVEFRGLK